jgi:hypothetical protein
MKRLFSIGPKDGKREQCLVAYPRSRAAEKEASNTVVLKQQMSGVSVY